MKTKVLKFGMPLMAFLLAIVFAFATDGISTQGNDTLVQGYIFQNNDCIPTTMVCNNQGSVPCAISGKQVYALDLGTFCDSPLTHRQW